MWLKIMVALDAKTSDVSVSDSDPDSDTAIDLADSSTFSTSKSSSVPSLLGTLRAPKPSDLK